MWGTLRVVTARELVLLSGSFTSHSKSARWLRHFTWSCKPQEIHSLQCWRARNKSPQAYPARTADGTRGCRVTGAHATTCTIATLQLFENHNQTFIISTTVLSSDIIKKRLLPLAKCKWSYTWEFCCMFCFSGMKGLILAMWCVIINVQPVVQSAWPLLPHSVPRSSARSRLQCLAVGLGLPGTTSLPHLSSPDKTSTQWLPPTYGLKANTIRNNTNNVSG